MARKKLIRIEEAMALPNIIHHDADTVKDIIAEFYAPSKYSFLELGCGRGEYTVGLSEIFPEAKCMGVDIQGERIWHGAKHALDTNNNNMLFLRAHIGQIDEYIPAHAIDEIWIPFPDPFPRKKQIKKRLTSPRFLKMYKKILKSDGVINLKTDNENLYHYSKEVIESLGIIPLIACEDIYQEMAPKSEEENRTSPLFIKTNFERKFLQQGKKIYYLRFQLPEHKTE